MYRVYYLTVKNKKDNEEIYTSAGLTEKTLHKLIAIHCKEENFPYWIMEITSEDYKKQPWWLKEN